MVLARAALDALDAVTAHLPEGGETREGQRAMAAAVADAIESGRHLLVQAGTGTGKSLAYLVPAVLSGKRVVVATATKALQGQILEQQAKLPSYAPSSDVERTATLNRFSGLLDRSVELQIKAVQQ